MTERLFSYGTLQLEAVQLAIFGRSLVGAPDVMTGYRLEPLDIDDEGVRAVRGFGRDEGESAAAVGRERMDVRCRQR